MTVKSTISRNDAAGSAGHRMTAAQQRIHQAALRVFAEKDPTLVDVKELAVAAKVARGTIYNNLDSIESLFSKTAGRLCVEMNERVEHATESEADPAVRLASGLRYYLRRAHEEPDWARFIVRHALTSSSLSELWNGPPMRDLQAGVAQKRFQLRPAQVTVYLTCLAGAVLGGIVLVLDGHGTWEEVGSDVAEVTLRGLGLPTAEARRVAVRKLAPLPLAV
ncbi:TetR/AcrR family transcriptional regulator [Cupriavidus basilensis]